MLRAHQRFDIWLTRSDFRGLGQHPLTLLRELMKRQERILDLFIDVLARVFTGITLNSITREVTS